MNSELLNQIHQIHQDLAVCRDGDTVELLRLTKNRKVDLDLLKDIHELYYHGHLHLPTYCGVFGYPKSDPIIKHFKNNHLKTLGSKLTHQLYGDQIQVKMKQTCLERFGFENPVQSPEILGKMKQTCLERFGVEHALQSPEILGKMKQTCLERFGVEHAYQSPDIQEKVRKTNLERYGCENPLESLAIREKVRKTNLERYGCENPLESLAIREKVRKTNLERYGVECTLQLPEVKEKIKSTNLKRYGVECTLQSPEIREKGKRTNLNRYGYEYAAQSSDIKGKIKQTNIERYGYPTSSQSPEIREKMKQTNLKRYGVECTLQSPEIREKGKRTNLERYGYEYALQSPDILEKMKQTCLDRYGHENPGQSPRIREKRKQTRKSNDRRYSKLLDLVENGSDKVYEFVYKNYTNCSKVLKRYGLYQENLSTPEAAIREILEKHQIEYLFRHRPKFMDGKELDFFIPSKNLAIEVNGLYWHSYPKKDKYYHQDKHLRCRSEGIQLLSFTEDQILEKLNIIESMILHKLGLTPYRVYAKKCDIRELRTQEAKDFLEKNHLHGFSNASVYLGLEYQGKLVHVMSFGNNRFKKSNHPELIRSASLRFHSVAGGFQRLLKYYKRSHGVDLVESYVDFNISNGKSYELASRDLGDLGNSSVRETERETKRDNLTEPDLWFTYGNKRYRRQMFMKHNIHKIFKDFPRRSDKCYKEINASEYLRDRGVLEYYGAGNLKYLI